MIQLAQQLGFKLILTTDHGTINVKNPSKVIGDKEIQSKLQAVSWNQEQVGTASDVFVFCAYTDVDERINQY